MALLPKALRSKALLWKALLTRDELGPDCAEPPPQVPACGGISREGRGLMELAVGLGLVAGLVCGAPPIASAQRAYSNGAPPPYVVAESHWGKGTVSGPVRPGRHGWQVRLPGGTWIDCVRSCSDTLRRQTLDFFESNGPQSRDDGPGYFRWRF